MTSTGATRRAERYAIGVVCSVGVGPERGGRPRNEDNYLVCKDGRVVWRDGHHEAGYAVPRATGTLLAVADGMGGHEDGELASAAAVQAVSRLYVKPRPEDPERTLREFLAEAHRRIRARVAAVGPVKMGTTLSVVWLLDGRAWWVHVGDSRIYHWRGGRLTRVTRDQTRGEFALRDSRPTPSNAHYLSQNFIYGSRGLGDDALLRIDRGIDTGSFGLLPGDRLVLCSDGLTSRVDDTWIADAVQNVPDPNACSVALLERAIAHQSDDNVTVMVVRVDDVPEAEGGTWDDELTIVPP